MGLSGITYARFRKFLNEMGCAGAFDRAFWAHNHCTSLDESLWEAGEAEFIFGHAFDWSATPEGREFWRQIDRAWALSLGRK